MNTKRFLIHFCGSLLGILILSIGLLCAVPPVSRDALVHHLAIPKMWLLHGGMYEIPQLIFSYYPMNLDLLYLIPLYFGNDILAKYIHFVFALATSYLIFSYLKNESGRLWGLLGVLLFLSTPVIVKLSLTAYVDLGLVFFSTAALVHLLKWRANFPRLPGLVFAAFFCGLALGTKYNALIVFVLLSLLVALIAARESSNRKSAFLRVALCTMIFAGVAGAIYSPWGVRNFVWTGNPFYPLFDNWFNGADSPHVRSLPPLVLRKLLYHETWLEIALVPLRIFFEGRDDFPRYFDGRLNPALLLLPLFAFAASESEFHRNRSAFEKWVLLAFAALLILITFFQANMRIRYLAPAIPCLVILSILGLKNLMEAIQKRFKRKVWYIASGLLVSAFAASLLLNASYIVKQFKIVMPFQYIDGTISRDQYIEKFRPEYGAIRHANAFLPADAKILSLFIGARGYYSDRAMVFDVEVFQSVVQQSVSAQEISAKLIQMGFTHMLIRFDMFGNWCHNNLNQKEKQMVDHLFNSNSTLVFSKKGHGLYKLQRNIRQPGRPLKFDR